eukprot:364033-Chlamydomonas_euryale.AAC.2
MRERERLAARCGESVAMECARRSESCSVCGSRRRCGVGGGVRRVEAAERAEAAGRPPGAAAEGKLKGVGEV